MEFQTDAQKEIYEKILPWMKEIFGAFVTIHDEGPWFGVSVGSAYTTINVAPWGKDEATITSRCYVVTSVELTPELMKYLLLENDRLRLGAFGIDNEDDIFFEHTIIGSTCDLEELKASVMAVVLTSDDYDEKIVQKFGGQRAVDRK
jgi:hypothetical protein